MDTREAYLEVALDLLRMACNADELGPLPLALSSAKVEPVADNLGHRTSVSVLWILTDECDGKGGKLDRSVNRNGTMPKSGGGCRDFESWKNIALLVAFCPHVQGGRDPHDTHVSTPCPLAHAAGRNAGWLLGWVASTCGDSCDEGRHVGSTWSRAQ